jgi:protein-L-isoaspartate(D-aspartate) O-methyltransferase
LDRIGRDVEDAKVLHAMGRVPREKFVPEPHGPMAYEDIPLPIGQEQTISQPYIVAMMVSALELRQTDRVLEVGTGSGYQTAILAELARHVVSVERIKLLADSARERLEALDYANFEVLQAGQELGCPVKAPYDAIIVAAGAPKLPQELMEQLATRGRLVIPVGTRESQELMKVERSDSGYSFRTMGACRFVPLIGEDAWSER